MSMQNWGESNHAARTLSERFTEWSAVAVCCMVLAMPYRVALSNWVSSLVR